MKYDDLAPASGAGKQKPPLERIVDQLRGLERQQQVQARAQYSISRAVRANAIKATLLALAIAIGLHAYAVAGFDRSGALEVLRSLPLTALLLGGGVALAPVLLLAVTVLVGLLAIRDGAQLDVEEMFKRIAVMLALAAVGALFDLTSTLAVTSVAFIVAVGSYLIARNTELEDFAIVSVLVFVAISIPLVVGTFTKENVSRPGLPAETVTLENGDELKGYVLDVDAQWTTVLLEEKRTIEKVATDQVDRREICTGRC